LIVLFQPDEEERGGAEAMINDELCSRVPVPDLMLAQHLTPLKSSLAAIREGPVLMATDILKVKVFGGLALGSI
jgi:metal-dependent amidase/aminoacylase/carboxypeptidase family protein